MNKTLAILLGLVMAGTLAFSLFQSQEVKAAAPGGLSATIATSTAVAIGSQSAQLLFATSTSNCISRIIGTAGASLTLTFSDFRGQRPTGTSGYFQASSTTVAYDSALYGCGAVYGWSSAAQTVLISETR